MKDDHSYGFILFLCVLFGFGCGIWAGNPGAGIAGGLAYLLAAVAVDK